MSRNVSKIHKIAIVTDDLKKTEEFYTKVLGLEPIERFPATKPGEAYIFLRAGDIILELVPSEAGPVGFHHISFMVDDPDSELAALKGEGVKCTMDPVDAGSGINIGFFEDPNGLKLQVFCRTKVKTLVWSERSEPSDVYPDGINGAIAEYLKQFAVFDVRTAQITDDKLGLSEEALNWADVLIWWGHVRHNDIDDTTLNRIVKRVKEDGMGFVPIHSSHYSRPFKALMGTPCGFGSSAPWGTEKLSVELPDHPISEGVEDFTIEEEEGYGEPFQVPEPSAVVLKSTYKDGTTFRSGITFEVGKGRIFYFRPGHETFPIMKLEMVRRIIRNAALWVAHRH